MASAIWHFDCRVSGVFCRFRIAHSNCFLFCKVCRLGNVVHIKPSNWDGHKESLEGPRPISSLAVPIISRKLFRRCQNLRQVLLVLRVGVFYGVLTYFLAFFGVAQHHNKYVKSLMSGTRGLPVWWSSALPKDPRNPGGCVWDSHSPILMALSPTPGCCHYPGGFFADAQGMNAVISDSSNSQDNCSKLSCSHSFMCLMLFNN